MQVIKPKDELIQELYQDNVSLHKELSKQANVIEEAEKYQNERDKILADNEELHNTVKHLEKEYKKKSNNLDFDFNNRKDELEEEYKEKSFELEHKYHNKIHKYYCVFLSSGTSIKNLSANAFAPSSLG